MEKWQSAEALKGAPQEMFNRPAMKSVLVEGKLTNMSSYTELHQCGSPTAKFVFRTRIFHAEIFFRTEQRISVDSL